MVKAKLARRAALAPNHGDAAATALDGPAPESLDRGAHRVGSGREVNCGGGSASVTDSAGARSPPSGQRNLCGSTTMTGTRGARGPTYMGEFSEGVAGRVVLMSGSHSGRSRRGHASRRAT